MAGRPDAVPATSRVAVTPLEPNTQWPGAATTETRSATAITAEIPAVPVAPAYGVLLPDGSIWYPGSKSKLPAPPFLRVIVWTLAFLVAIGGATLVVEHYQPSWLNPIRRVVGPPGLLPGTGTGTSTGTHPAPGQSSGMMQETAHGLNSVTYSVPGAPYVLTIKTTQRCYIRVGSLASGAWLLDNTLGADVSQPVTVPGGSATVEAFAGGSSLSVSVQGAQVGTVAKLGYAVVYRFNPPSS
ncbi:MAG: hypothetical protein ACLP36_01465 [Acidimicrobiales bacterium]